MASLGVFTIGSGGGGDDDAARFVRVPDPDRDRALALLLTGEARAHDPAVAEFLRFARDQHLDIRELWAAMVGHRMLASAMVVPSPGRTGMLFLSPVRSRDRIRLASELVRALVRTQDPSKSVLLQSLLDPPQHRELDALTAAGFRSLAKLVYMQRESESLGGRVAQGEFGEGLTTVHWSEQRNGLFERAILISYEQTLDCPGLLGLRDIGDVVAGHRATGVFDPRMWFVLITPDETPAAVMLLNELPGRSAIELVYLGLAPAWRGRGLARRLLEHGIDLAARRGLSAILLAVDEANTPALALYRGMGFRPTARKHALIHPLTND